MRRIIQKEVLSRHFKIPKTQARTIYDLMPYEEQEAELWNEAQARTRGGGGDLDEAFEDA